MELGSGLERENDFSPSIPLIFWRLLALKKEKIERKS